LWCGSSHALSAVVQGKTNADTIITSDMPHHVIKELIEKNKNIILIPHYVAEDYGFNKFYAYVKEQLNGKIQAYYFDDKRFK
jgi:putative NIF3 family GTP cyclohydrolase 1 type 2